MRYLISLLLIFVLAFAITAQDDEDDLEFDLPITESVTYTIRTGDTLDTIAALFDVSVECLRETNDLSRFAIIQPGDPLVISVDCPSYNGVMTVRFPREDVSADEVMTDDEDMMDDEEAMEDTTETEEDDTDDDTPTGSAGTYLVRYGDTLDVIGQELNVSVVSLILANDIEDPRDLRPDQTLIIPADAPAYGQFPPVSEDGTGTGGMTGDGYVVQERETVDGISARFNVDTDCVLEANGILNPRLLTPGTVLDIPSDCPEYRGYDVVPAEAQSS